MRCFIAIDAGGVRKAVEALIRDLRKTDADVRWVPTGGMHLTLKFLGETEEALIPKIESSLRAVASRHSRFVLTVAGTGAFPGYSRPRVLWVGIEGSEELKRLYEDIELEMERLGYSREKRAFRPHLTIGRVRSGDGLGPVVEKLKGYKGMEFGKIDVGEVVLMRSILKPTGAEYEEIFSARLRKED